MLFVDCNFECNEWQNYFNIFFFFIYCILTLSHSCVSFVIWIFQNFNFSWDDIMEMIFPAESKIIVIVPLRFVGIILFWQYFFVFSCRMRLNSLKNCNSHFFYKSDRHVQQIILMHIAYTFYSNTFSFWV